MPFGLIVFDVLIPLHVRAHARTQAALSLGSHIMLLRFQPSRRFMMFIPLLKMAPACLEILASIQHAKGGFCSELRPAG